MGNCQAIDTATLVIQHPCGKVDKLYWPVCASEIMKANPGHYVALLISTTLCPTANTKDSGNGRSTSTATANTNTATATTNSVRVTRIKLLRPTDTLVLGQVYRLITAQEVMKVLSAKKYAKMKKGMSESADKIGDGLEIEAPRRSDVKKDLKIIKNINNQQAGKSERHRQKAASSATNSAATPKPRTWQPSLQSISESAS